MILMQKNIKVNNAKNVTAFKREVQSLDEIFRLLRMKKCNFLKVDCEGYEYKIFRKSQKSLAKIEHIAMEIHLFDEKMVEEFTKLKKQLRFHGFSIIEEENPVHSYLKFLYASKK